MTDRNWPNSKELYMMNGGNKIYIYKDGFGDIYCATPEEEAAWAQEVIANELRKVDTEENTTGLTFAIENLSFHNYPGLEQLLISKLNCTSTKRQIVFATALWKLYKSEKSFPLIHRLFIEDRNCMNDFFWGLSDFKANEAAALFLISCLEGSDEILFAKAYTTLSTWSYTGLPELRGTDLLNRLAFQHSQTKTFVIAMQELKNILFKK